MKSRCRQALAFSENRRSAAIFCFICDKKGVASPAGGKKEGQPTIFLPCFSQPFSVPDIGLLHRLAALRWVGTR